MRQRIMVVAAILASLLGACAREQPPTVDVAFDNVCSQPEGTTVAIQGYFRLPENMKTYTRLRRTSYEMYFAASIQPNSPFISAAVPGTASGGAKNQIAALHDGYSYKDLRIFLDDGRAVGPESHLKITGTLSRLAIGCSIAVSRIEPATTR